MELEDMFDGDGFTLPDSESNKAMTAEELQSKIHELVARALIRNLEDPALSTNPQILTAAMKFLKDNDVSGLAVPGSPLAELSKHFEAPFKLKRAEGQ